MKLSDFHDTFSKAPIVGLTDSGDSSNGKDIEWADAFNTGSFIGYNVNSTDVNTYDPCESGVFFVLIKVIHGRLIKCSHGATLIQNRFYDEIRIVWRPQSLFNLR